MKGGVTREDWMYSIMGGDRERSIGRGSEERGSKEADGRGST